jgi:hypothetical protein
MDCNDDTQLLFLQKHIRSEKIKFNIRGVLQLDGELQRKVREELHRSSAVRVLGNCGREETVQECHQVRCRSGVRRPVGNGLSVRVLFSCEVDQVVCQLAAKIDVQDVREVELRAISMVLPWSMTRRKTHRAKEWNALEALAHYGCR